MKYQMPTTKYPWPSHESNTKLLYHHLSLLQQKNLRPSACFCTCRYKHSQPLSSWAERCDNPIRFIHWWARSRRIPRIFTVQSQPQGVLPMICPRKKTDAFAFVALLPVPLDTHVAQPPSAVAFSTFMDRRRIEKPSPATCCPAIRSATASLNPAFHKHSHPLSSWAERHDHGYCAIEWRARSRRIPRIFIAQSQPQGVRPMLCPWTRIGCSCRADIQPGIRELVIGGTPYFVFIVCVPSGW